MPPINLTEGAIDLLSSGDAQHSDIKPLLQVADIRLVNTQNQNTERYRILLSDGSFTQQGMLATQLNHLVQSEKLQKGSIVQLKQFVCNLIQNRRIIIIIDLDVIVEKCDPIGELKPYPIKNDGNVSSAARSSRPSQPMNQPAGVSGNPPSYGAGNTGIPPSYSAGNGANPPSYSAGNSANPPSYGAGSVISASAPRPISGSGSHAPPLVEDRNAGAHPYGSSFSSNMDPGTYTTSNAPPMYNKSGAGSGVSRTPVNNYVRPPHSSYNQPPSMFANRGPIAKNEAPPRIVPIASLDPYQGRWTIKARVTSKAELRHYSNARGDGKVFSFDLLDSHGGEIRVTCFNAVADQYYHQIEPGKVYMISKGTLKPAQKAFNHLHNDYEITLDNTSTVQPCSEDDQSIPQQQFHFRPISDIEGLQVNAVIDVIGIVSSIGPSSSIMRKNGTETQKRTFQLKDMSGRSVEVTLWGNFCNAEGQTVQNMCDSGVFPVVAVKSGRVNDFNGKSLGTIANSQLFIEPDFPEAQKLKTWFNNEGKNTPAISISREASIVRSDVRKTISQIKDEKLGTSEKPDWITVPATLIYLKVDNFCYTACRVMIGDRQCNKKVTNNGDGKWRCERCDQLIDECDYRYILQMQIQDHTGLTWATAFQESGEEIMGIPAKDLYFLKHEEQDDEKFTEVVRNVLFSKFLFKLKVKEEFFSDEQRVKSTVVKAEKVNFPTETRYLLDSIAKLKGEDLGSSQPKAENIISTSGLSTVGFAGSREPVAPPMNYSGINSNVVRESGPSQLNSHRNLYGGSGLSSTSTAGMYMSCGSCGATGHDSANCPSLMSGPGQSYGTSVGNRVAPGVGGGGGGGGGECFKCHQFGHWARDCPGVSNAPAAHGGNNANPGRYGMAPKQHVGGF